jgi:hypothetical protein
MLLALAACDPSEPARRVVKPEQPQEAPKATQQQIDALKVLLQDAVVEANVAAAAINLSGCNRINSFAGSFSTTAQQVTPWWEAFTPIENFFLFECTPRLAPRAPIEARASAYCAGVAEVNADWWGVPGSNVSQLTIRLLAIGKQVAPCLVAVFQSDDALRYSDTNEAVAIAKNKGWTRADLAAGLVALIFDKPYELGASPAERRARRVELAKLTGSASP